MDENQIIDIWSVFKEYIDKKSVNDVAERFVDTLVDYGVSDFTLRDCLGQDNTLDEAIEYYLDDVEDDLESDNSDWDD